MVPSPILVFPKWDIKFHVHVVASCIAVGIVLMQEGVEGIDHLIAFAKAQPVKDYTAATTTKFLFDNVLTWFGCPKFLMSDHGTHFLNETISVITEEFQIYHQEGTPYHLKANGTVEAFDKILETTLTKICSSQRNDWDLRIPTMLWAYQITCKKLTGQTYFKLVYGTEVIMPMEYIVPSLRIASMTGMADHEALEERLAQLEELEEEWFLEGFHQHVHKQDEKCWHNHHINLCTFKVDDLVLSYDSKFEKFPGKL
eukprot:PITA_12405